MAVLLLCFALVAIEWPLVIIVPAIVFPVWIAVSLLIRAYRLHATYKRAQGSKVKDDGSKADSHHVRVATYNIHKCRGLDGRVRPERIVEVLRELKRRRHRAAGGAQPSRQPIRR